MMSLIGLAVRAQESASPPETLTVDEAVRLALRNNPTLRSSELDVDEAGDDLAAFRTKRLPSFKWSVLGGQLLTKPSITFDRGVFGDYANVGPIPSRETKVTIPRRPAAFALGQIVQPLSQQYKLGLGVKAHELERQIESAKLAQKKAEIAENVRKSYYKMLETQSALNSVEQSLPLYKETVRLASVGLRLETVLPSQRLKAEADQAKVELDALTLRNPIATQMEQLNELMGRSVTTRFQTVAIDQIVEERIDPDQAIQTALSQRPELRKAQLQIKQADLEVRMKRAEYIPDVSLALIYSSAFNLQSGAPRNITTAGINFEWEVFDWGRKKDEMSSRRRVASQARIAEEALERRIRVEVAHAVRQCTEAAQRVRVSTLVQRAARQDLREQQAAFVREAVLLKDVLQSTLR